MKKFLLSLAVSVAFALLGNPANAAYEEVGSGGSVGDTFAIRAFNTGTSLSKQYIFCTSGTNPTCNVHSDMMFDGVTLPVLLGGYATTGALAAVDARVGTMEGSTFSGSYLDLTNKPSLFSGAYSDLSGKPSLFSGAYSDLSGKPSLFSGSYVDLTNKPTIPATFDQLTDGSTNKAFTGTLLTKLSGIASGATANSPDATLLARANHTGTQAESTVTNLTTDLANRATVYNGTSLMANPVVLLKAGSTNGSGLAVFNLTADNTSTGTALCPTAVSAVNVDVNSSTAAYGTSWAMSGKVLTVTVTQPTSLLSLGILPNVAVASGVTVNARVFCN